MSKGKVGLMRNMDRIDRQIGQGVSYIPQTLCVQGV